MSCDYDKISLGVGVGMIDLKDNVLRVGGGEVAVPFLPGSSFTLS